MEKEIETNQVITISDIETLKIISDPLRLKILELIRVANQTGELRTTKQLAQTLDMTQPKLYYHIKQLQKHAFVKAFGFQELLASEDVFSLMGLQGEDKYAFRDFPRENKLPVTKEQEQAIEVEIIKALNEYGFYDRIMKAQMFE